MVRSRNKVVMLNILSTIVLQGVAFISGPLFSKILGTANFGIVTVYFTWVQLASTIFPLQAGGAIALAKVDFPENEQLNYQSSVLTLASLSYGVFSIVAFIFCICFMRDYSIGMLLCGLLQGWGMYCVSFMNSKLTYEFKADKNILLSLSAALLNILLSYILVVLSPVEFNYWGRIVGQSIVYGFLGCMIALFVWVKGRTSYKKEYWVYTLIITVPTIVHLLANIVLNQSDTIMLQNMMGNSDAGVYALASTFGTVINAVWGALNNSWVPFFYEYMKENNTSEIRKHTKNYIELFTIITIGFILLSREVFHIYADKAFWGGTGLVPLFAIGHYFIFLYSFPVNYEFYYKKTRTIALGTGLAAVCNIVLNFIFIHRMGMFGAVVATVIAHMLQFVFHYLSAKGINRDKFPYKMKEFIPGLIVICVVALINEVMSDYGLIRWSIGTGLGVFLIYRTVSRKEVF